MELWKRQKKALTAFGIFLAFMFLCTLISRAVYVFGLPQVTVAASGRMAIQHTVEAEGIVSQGREYAVTSMAGLRVGTVYTYVGQKITPETLLFDLDMEDLEDKIEAQELAVRKLQLQITDQEAARNLNGQKKQMESHRAREDYQRAEEESGEILTRAEEDLKDAEDALEAHRRKEVPMTSEGDRKAAREAYEEWMQKEQELKTGLEQAQKAYEAAREEVKRLEAEQKESELEEARRKESAAREALDSARAVYESHCASPVPNPDFSAEDEAKAAWDREKENLKAAVKEAERGVEDAEQSRTEAMREADRNRADADVPSEPDSSLEISRLELDFQQKQLEAFREIFEKGGKVYPEVESIVTQIQVRPGERVPDGAAVVCADLSSPLQFRATLTKEQKKYVNQGAKAKLMLGGSSAAEVTVDYVRESGTAPELYEVYILLQEGEGTIGQSGTLKAEIQTETYPVCIPTDALHEDASRRDYVYIVRERAGILGNELAAEKVYVKVLDQNDRYTAIEEGVIDRDTEVIVSSTEPLEDRMIIRYRE